MSKVFAFFFFILSGLGSGEVRVNQSRNKDQYMEGDFAVFQCSITFDTESVQQCRLGWGIQDPHKKDGIIEVKELLQLEGRVHISSNKTHSFMILERLMTNDTDVFLCYATCTIDQRQKLIFGKDTKLAVKAPIQSRTWLHYLIFGIDLLIYMVATIICATIIRNRRKRRSNMIQNA